MGQIKPYTPSPKCKGCGLTIREVYLHGYFPCEDCEEGEE